MKVDAKQLWQAVKNVSIYSRKDGWAGAVEVSVYFGGEISFRTSDDFVGIDSRVRATEDIPDGERFYLSHESVKDLEKCLRDKTGEVELSVSGPDGVLVVGEFSTKPFGCPNEDWWDMFTYVMDHANAFPSSEAVSWALDPARLSKFNLLEPKAEFPLALSNCYVDSDSFVAFKYGPNTFGMIKPLERDALEKVYDDISEVLW